MSVNPGFSGQRFIPASLDKVRRLRAQIQARGLSAVIEVDGGVDATNIRAVAEAGAEVMVAGSAVYGGGDPESAARRLIEAAR
jgi:ribulose-phosphate 3-epimerase